jgi:hypothetical protein
VSAAMSEHGDQLKQEMGDVVDTAKDQVVELRDTARTRLTDEADRRRDELGTGARRIADATRETGRQLHDEGKDLPAMMIDRAAVGLDRAASYLENTDADSMWNDLRDMGRRAPWVFVAAGMAAGFAMSRMIKAAGANDQWAGQRPMTPMRDDASLGTGEDLATPMSTTGQLGTEVSRIPDAPDAPTVQQSPWAAGAAGATGS